MINTIERTLKETKYRSKLKHIVSGGTRIKQNLRLLLQVTGE